MTLVAQTLAVARKDLRIEVRGRYALAAVLPFAGTLLNSTVQWHISRCRALTARPRRRAASCNLCSRRATTSGGQARATSRPATAARWPSRQG